jgi:hypothetical protein
MDIYSNYSPQEDVGLILSLLSENYNLEEQTPEQIQLIIAREFNLIIDEKIIYEQTKKK